MKKSILAFAIAAALALPIVSAPAQEQAPAPERNYTLTFAPNEIPLLNEALVSLPKRVADPFIGRLQAQINAQDAKAAADAKAKADAEAAKDPPKK